MPSKFDFGSSKTIEILYDAVGQKLRKTVKDGTTILLTQDYLGGIEIKNNRLEAIYNEEGRAYNTNNDPFQWRYEYNLKDHLGNTRVSFSDLNGNGIIDSQTEVLSETHYYPFGLQFDGAWYDNNTNKNRYLYNGKEWNSEFGLNLEDYGARWYDPSIGRWWVVDPITQNQEPFSPYHYVADNPVRLTDPDGRYPEEGGPPDGKGIIRDVTDEQATGSINGAIARFSFDALSAMGMNAIDNAVANFFDPSATSTDKFVGVVDAMATNIHMKGTGGGLSPHLELATVRGTKAYVATTTGSTRLILKNEDGSKSDNISSRINIKDDDKIDRGQLNPPTKKGNAPTFKRDGTSVEIHHEGQNPKGPFKEMHWEDHRGKGKDAINHPNKSKPSQVERKSFEKERKIYWKNEYPK